HSVIRSMRASPWRRRLSRCWGRAASPSLTWAARRRVAPTRSPPSRRRTKRRLARTARDRGSRRPRRIQPARGWRKGLARAASRKGATASTRRFPKRYQAPRASTRIQTDRTAIPPVHESSQKVRWGPVGALLRSEQRRLGGYRELYHDSSGVG